MSDESSDRVRIAIAVVERNNHYLVGTRSENQSLPGKAEFPGGKLEPGESPEECVVREVQEETGLHVEVIDLLEVINWSYPETKLELHFFNCRVIGNAPTAPAGNFRWVNTVEMAQLQWPEANQAVIDRLMTN